ncbi:MAG: tRNA lysidine(34) synthetase TilS [Reyranella sp.]|uniref:tRNA lysidine(34) synthetase TilS n=1 Tax=Reyranella sp. TaxID=1929291 RepID=UPI001AC5986A|nr:tRNA lysidine(34) synthetase TilS [Reyranella sp.]MBN9089123.1 tRNA lysidine(34) synthetase TilS [Reyranella sp.]
MADAVEAPEFAALLAPFAPFEAQPALAVAVSGGRDSLALALLAHEWALARRGRVLALIVDHGLRRESADEARTTRERLAGRGIESEILLWAGDKPATRIQQAAREARYRLLFAACRRHGILHLMTAHHADDQDETVAMRAARESGPDGLAGMAAVVEHRDLRLLRPLLGVPRRRLTATIEARGVDWIDDPSNQDRRFERVRVRQDGAAAGAARDAGRAVRDRTLAETALGALEVGPEGVALDHVVVSVMRKEITERLLSRIVQAVGGLDYPPRRERLSRAAARLSQGARLGKSGKGQDFTLSGCKLMLRRDSATRRLRWIVRPENGRTRDNKPGQPLVPAAFFACGASAATHLD